MKYCLIIIILLLISCNEKSVKNDTSSVESESNLNLFQSGYGVFMYNGVEAFSDREKGLTISVGRTTIGPLFTDNDISENTFFYITNPNEIWLYNGINKLCLIHQQETKTTFSVLETSHYSLTLPVPKAILDKLSTELIAIYNAQRPN